MNTGTKQPAKSRLGPLEQRFLSYAQLKKLSLVRFGQLREVLELTADQERKLLSRLARGGAIVRLKRGVYLVPPQLPLGGVWNPGEAVILRELMRACDDGRCQFCGWPVFNRYGFTEQVPARISVYNNRIYGPRTIAGREFTFIKVPDRRLGGTEPEKSPGGEKSLMPTRARALIDAVVDWSRFGTLPDALGWIRETVSKDPGMTDRIADAAGRFGNQGTIRRIGYILEQTGLSDSFRRRLGGKLRSKKSIIPLVPSRPTRGSVNADWGIIDNE
jgi:predicted transcriptional regulator of viral defense system